MSSNDNKIMKFKNKKEALKTLNKKNTEIRKNRLYNE